MTTSGIVEKVFLNGTITALTGLRVGGSDQGLSVGGIDNIVIRHALLNEPYIPGSSLRGKMRCSIERLQGIAGKGHGDMITFGPCDDRSQWTVQLFGNAANEGEALPSRVLMRDALLTAESRKQLDRLRGDLRMTETKTEVCIDRVTSAANPRTFERVPAGAAFAFEMVLEVRALSPKDLDPKALESAKPEVKRLLELLAEARNEGNGWGRDLDLKWLLTGLDLIQDDALGGQGSRGYGRVKVELDLPKVRTRADYHEGKPGRELELTPELNDMVRALNTRGERDLQSIKDALPRPLEAP